MKESIMRCHDCKHPIHKDDDARVCINCGGRNSRIASTNKSFLISKLKKKIMKIFCNVKPDQQIHDNRTD